MEFILLYPIWILVLRLSVMDSTASISHRFLPSFSCQKSSVMKYSTYSLIYDFPYLPPSAAITDICSLTVFVLSPFHWSIRENSNTTQLESLWLLHAWDFSHLYQVTPLVHLKLVMSRPDSLYFQFFGLGSLLLLTNAHLFEEQERARSTETLLMACHILLLCCICFFCFALRTFIPAPEDIGSIPMNLKIFPKCPGGEYFYVLPLRWGCFRMMLTHTWYLLHTNQRNNNSGHLISKHVL